MTVQFTALNPFAISSLLTALSSASFGLLVLIKSENKRLGRIWCAFAFSVAGYGVGSSILSTTSDATRAFLWWRLAYAFGVIWIAPTFYWFACAFTHRSNRFVPVQFALGLLSLAILPSSLFFSRVRWVFHSFYYAYQGKFYWLYFIWWIALVFYSHYILILAYQKSSFKTRNQIIYFLVATGVGFGGGCLSYLPHFGIDLYPWGNFTIALYPIIMSYAILKHQLMDVTLVLRKTLIYSVLSACFAAVYVMSLMVITRFFEGRWIASSIYSSAIAAGIITLVFDPLRKRVQNFIDSRFSRLKLDREERLVHFSAELAKYQNPQETTERLRRILDETLQPERKHLFVHRSIENDFYDVLSEAKDREFSALPFQNRWTTRFARSLSPVRAENTEEEIELRRMMRDSRIALSVPMFSRGALLGFLILGQKRSDELYDDEDVAMLKILANQVAIVFEQPRRIRELSSGMVHEIKLPMANITLPAELTYLQVKNAMDHQLSGETLLPIILKRMKFIMEQALLAGRRVDAIQLIDDNERTMFDLIDLPSLLAELCAYFEPLALAHRVEVRWVCKAKTLTIAGDTEQLRIAIGNVLKNAIEAMAETYERSRRLEMVAHESHDRAIITIQDSGPGISTKLRSLIFNSDYSTKGAAGSGMGLYLTKKILEKHNGSILLLPSNKGARFEISFPTYRPPDLKKS